MARQIKTRAKCGDGVEKMLAKVRAGQPHPARSVVPPLYFSLARASVSDPLQIVKVIAVTMPLCNIRDRHALHNYVLKKILHKSYALTAEEMKQKHSRSSTTSTSSDSPLGPWNNREVPLFLHHDMGYNSNAYVVVHISSIEVHANTVCQVNTKGDVQFNVKLSMIVARLHHGLLTGVAENSPYHGCMQVRLQQSLVHHMRDFSSTRDDASNNHVINEVHGHVDMQSNDKVCTEIDAYNDSTQRTGNDTTVGLTITVRCTEDEPVVAGQAVLVVSEPGITLRCLAFRAPRCAPGPFHFAQSTMSKGDPQTEDVEILCDSAAISSMTKPLYKRRST